MNSKKADVESRTSDAPCPLSTLSDGEYGTVVKLSAGRQVLRRMVSLGLIPGTKVTVVQNPKYGPLIVSVRDARVAMGRGEAEQVQVKRSG